MLAAVFHGVEIGIKLEDVPIPKIEKPKEVLVRVHRCGMCGTDLASIDGRNIVSPPVVLGHEMAGEVESVGAEVRTLRPGDRVTIDPNLYCGVCTYCRSNRENLCPNMTTIGEQLNGGYAQYVVAPERAVFKVPESMDWDVISLLEPLSCVVNGVGKAAIRPGESAVVYGAGTMGLLWLSLLKRAGAGTLIAVEPAPNRAEAALKVGADRVIDPKAHDPVAEVWRLTNGRGTDVAAEVIGRPDTVELAVRSTGYGGRTIVMGVCKPDAKSSFLPFELMRFERRIMGTHIANGGFPLAIEELAKGFVKTEVFITHKIPLRDFSRAVELNRRGESVKTLIIPGD